ncbi:hypothetical protein [Ornithinimicrobium sediminis]|uniref:hypothetical protein n=1 Tax=Ornithinimicrobium sediminis TaxID=2904603 RepID=UPI001E36AE44|nr:hypothetical protein [Ornithinimicrobium sediminis]MCE0487511.1 hypothetical protein [Ornithinimicrobium sediminis]
MSIEGPHSSPEGGDPTTLSAVEPLPPGGQDITEIVDAIDQRIRQQGSESVRSADEAADEAPDEESSEVGSPEDEDAARDPEDIEPSA